ncbi:hypothetical protein PO124_14880 [Bacillus licheniformis]|nr:hypothetical protein [Bacillus licheniformis]
MTVVKSFGGQLQTFYNLTRSDESGKNIDYRRNRYDREPNRQRLVHLGAGVRIASRRIPAITGAEHVYLTGMIKQLTKTH